MSDYRITCTNQTGCTQGGHIIGVGTGDDRGWDRQWTVQEVYDAMRVGNRFWTYGGTKWAQVFAHPCACGAGTLRSAADSTTANNLDNLGICRWSAA